MRRPSFVFCCFVLLLVAATGTFHSAWGQEVTAAIVGTVVDASGAPIKGASVVASDVDHGTQSTVLTNDAGAYNLNRLAVGTYTLKVTSPGFQTAVHPPLTLVLNQTARIDVQMKVGTVTESVEVTGGAPILKTESAQVDTIIDAKTNDQLPLATRNYVQLTLLAPGSVTPNPKSFNNGDNTASGGRPYINGNREQANNFILDGVDNNQVSDNLVGFTPAPDAIQEFNLITQNASAEFGNYQGGIVSTTIKSGTNGFHGDLWEFFRNDKLNSNSWENRFNGSPRPKLRWNMFGGTVGGPIIKNKLFFFFDYQAQRFDHPSTTLPLSVFTTAERAGDFGDICPEGFTAGLCNNSAHQLYDPLVLDPITNKSVPFANNVITEPIDPVASALFASSLYPTPVGAGTQANASYTQNGLVNTSQYDIKIDFNATANDHLFGRFSHAKQHNPTINSFALLGTGFSDAPINNYVVDWSHTFSSNLLNDLRFGVNHVKLHNGTEFASSVGNLGTDLGIANANAGGPGLLELGFNGGNPSGPGTGVLTNVGSNGVQQRFQDAVIQASDAVVMTHNRHVLHMGFEYWRDRINTFYTGNSGALGAIIFNGAFSSSDPTNGDPNNKPTGGYGGADFYMGLPSSYGKGVSGGEWGQRASIVAGYIQDDWRATNNLTINLGLRYEAHTPWVEIQDRQVNFDLITGEVIAPNCSKVNLGTAPVTCRPGSRGLYDGTYGAKDFQPRIGFAWTPAMLGDRTVIRGAYSISSYLEGTGTNLRLPINPPFTPAETLAQYNNVQTPPTTTDDGLAPVGAASDPFAGALVRVWDPHVQPAITQQWNGTVQHQFGTNTIQVGYVGQHGTHLMVPMPYLQKQLLANSACATPPCTAPSVFFSGNPAFQSDISQISGTASVGSMNYHALQAVFQKRYSSGLQYQVAYTFSRCRTDNSGYYGNWGAQSAPANPYYQNLYDPKADWADCFFDSKHVLSSYAVYDIPFGRGRRFGHDTNKAVDAIVGGWSIAPIISIHSGFPLALYDFGTDVTGTNSRGLRPDCGAGAGRTFGRKSVLDANGKYLGYQWFDASPYSAPAVGTFGNCPAQGPVRGPGYGDLDLSLQKNFLFTEAIRLQFRADFLNAFNRVNLNTPATALGDNMGLVNTSSDPRVIQFSLKLYY
jgi:Carboxypeptidase regulatory-like domain